MGMETVCYQKRVLKFTIDHGLDMKALPVLQFYKKKKTNHEEEIKQTISKPEKTIQFYEEL